MPAVPESPWILFRYHSGNLCSSLWTEVMFKYDGRSKSFASRYVTL